MPTQAQLDALEQGRTGGDRWATTVPIIAAIEAALGEADDAEIREAFGLGDWRAVTAEHRARYGEYFAPKVYQALVDAMRNGLLVDKRLAIKDFATFQLGQMEGQLFPVNPWSGPCRQDEMHKVQVTVRAGDVESYDVAGEYEGRWSRPYQGAPSVVEGFFENFGVIDRAAGLFVVPGEVWMVFDYGGLFEEKRRVCGGWAVRGFEELRPGYAGANESTRLDLVVTDPAPEIEGLIEYGGFVPIGFGGPYVQSVTGRMPFLAGNVYSKWYFDQFGGVLAEKVLSKSAVHSIDTEGLPLTAAAFVNCFPRERWVSEYERYIMLPDGSYGPVTEYSLVEWVGRVEWFERYGGNMAEWEEEGVIIPPELVGERPMGARIYAKFAPSFIAALNEVPEA